MVTEEGFTISKARSKMFLSLVMKEGELTRGSLVSKMGCGSTTFSHEYRDYLEMFTAVKYYKKERIFRFEP